MTTPAAKTSPNCVVCLKRPKRRGTLFCWACTEAAKDAGPAKDDGPYKGVKFIIVWKGNAIKMVQDGPNSFRPAWMGKVRIAKSKVPPSCQLIELDKWLPGYTRQQIKKMKSAFMELTPNKVVHTNADGSRRLRTFL